MAHIKAQKGNLFAVRWGEPTPEDVDAVTEAVASQHRERGEPLAYMAIMSEGAPRLSDEGRKALLSLTETVLPSVAQLVVVIEAQGFQASFLRSALTAMTMVSSARGKVHFVGSVDVALDKLASCMETEQGDVEAVLLAVQARSRGALPSDMTGLITEHG